MAVRRAAVARGRARRARVRRAIPQGRERDGLWRASSRDAIADQLKLRQDIFIAELQLEPLLAGIEADAALSGNSCRYRGFRRSSGISRWCWRMECTFAQVVEAIRALAIPELRGVEALDLFRGGQIPAGKFSLMIRVTFQSAEATLTDAQIADFSSRIVGALETKLGAALRAS